MSIHDWTRVDAGLFHSFRLGWAVALRASLNEPLAAHGAYALLESDSMKTVTLDGDLGVEDELLREAILYARRADRIVVKDADSRLIAVIEIVSPGNKASHSEFRRFLAKSVELLQQGVHLLIVDLFPPTSRDPGGIHGAIWGELTEETFDWPDDRRRTVVSYDAGPPYVAYVEPISAGMNLPRAQLFLAPEVYVPAPLEETYQDAWKGFPSALRGLLEPLASSRTT